MPELPEVETTKASLLGLIGCAVRDVFLSGKRLREPVAPDLPSLVGYRLAHVDRRAKYLILSFQKPACQQKRLLIHLGMSGSLGQYNSAQNRAHDHAIFALDNGVFLHYYDPRRFGVIAWEKDAARCLRSLGVEPLDRDFDGDFLHQAIHKNPSRPSARPIKSLIMDQRLVVGVGNIYACESLFKVGIHPATPAGHLSVDQAQGLALTIKDTLAQAIQAGGSSLKDFRFGGGQVGYFQQSLFVYGRENDPCLRCQTPIQNLKIAGRASFFCPRCQSACAGADPH